MAKTIKFNLICDGKPVRTIEDLRNHFSIEDVLKYYHNELLQRWLEVRGYSKELEKVNRIEESDDLSLIKSLIYIFEVEADQSEIERNTYILKYAREMEERLDSYKKNAFQTDSILKEHYLGYQHEIINILENKNDMGKIKASLKIIEENYYNLFQLNYCSLFDLFMAYAPMAIFAMLMRETMRMYYLPSELEDYKDNILKYWDSQGKTEEFLKTENLMSILFTFDAERFRSLRAVSSLTMDIDEMDSSLVKWSRIDSSSVWESSMEKKTNQMHARLKQMVMSEKLKEVLEDNLLEFSGETDGYWKDVESSVDDKGNKKQYMILKMAEGNYVRSSGDKDGDLKKSDIEYSFVILDGVDYKSNNANHKLLYMEV